MLCGVTEETRETIEQAKKSLAEMLLVDIQTAMVSLDLSEATRNPETRDGERRTAQSAYGSINQSLTTRELRPEDRERVNAALEPLKSRLDALGPIPPAA